MFFPKTPICNSKKNYHRNVGNTLTLKITVVIVLPWFAASRFSQKPNIVERTALANKLTGFLARKILQNFFVKRFPSFRNRKKHTYAAFIVDNVIKNFFNLRNTPRKSEPMTIFDFNQSTVILVKNVQYSTFQNRNTTVNTSFLK